MTSSTPANADSLPPGFILAARYEVVAPLGSGGQGVVYEVFDHHLKQRSALKIQTGIAPHEAWKEAELLVRLSGEFLLPVRNADLVSGLPYVVTEVAQHGTTEDGMTRAGVPYLTAARWVTHACRGIARMHDIGLVHNDLKPGNLFLNAHGNALLGDLGYASQLQPGGDAALTGGTPTTMPPEVAAAVLNGLAGSLPCSVRSDIYGLGATLYWLLAGRPPYVGPDFQHVLTQVVAGPPQALQNVAPHVPLGLRHVVEKAMSRSASGRYQSAAEMDYALARLNSTGRIWTRIQPHETHVDCFEGAKGASLLAVCVIQTGVRDQHQIVVKHKRSGRSASDPVLATPTSLSQQLRRAFRRHS